MDARQMKRVDKLREQLRKTVRRDVLVSLAPALLIIAAAFGVTFLFIKPAPPRHLTVATPEDEGGARWFARKYKESLAKHGVTLEVVPTHGSAANVQLLKDPASKVDVAFVQSGTVQPGAEESDGRIVSLGSLTYTPMWVFYRSDGAPLDDLSALIGKRVAVGADDSGTRALALTLLEANGAPKESPQYLSVGRDEAVKQLTEGTIDAAILVSPAEAPVIKRLAATPGVRLMSFARAEAYVRRFPYLSKLVLPRGVLDLKADVPAEDIVLLSPTANLVARDSVHPALAYLLMRAASEIHGTAGMLDRAKEFPAPLEAGFPLSPEAKRYYESGAPLLQRYLPFWAANLVDRMWVMLVPLLAIIFPTVRAVPALYRWRIRSRVFRWYARLKEIEIQLEEDPDRATLAEMLKRLEEIEESVNHIQTPLAYTENLYFFREHVDVVRRRLLRRLEGRDDQRGRDGSLESA